jgi:hypothetical protein
LFAFELGEVIVVFSWFVAIVEVSVAAVLAFAFAVAVAVVASLAVVVAVLAVVIAASLRRTFYRRTCLLGLHGLC